MGAPPSSLAGLSLTSLYAISYTPVCQLLTIISCSVVNAQTPPSLGTLLASPTLQSSLTSLDLSRSPLDVSAPPSFAPLSHLTQLLLPGTGLSGALPDAFPPALAVLSLADNPALGAPLPGALCGAGALTSCDLRGTALPAGGACGVCVFA
jgi:hypothetical protein